METQELKSIVEALIFAADEPLSEARLRETLELENGFEFGAVIEGLNEEYQNSGRAFTIRKIAGGYQIVTQQNYASWIKKLYLGRQKNRLSHAALETLALIAFKQPISRVDIAQIRGVNSDGVIGTLLERKLVTISGRSEAVGRPLLYSTTAEFLKYFGINDIADLPKPREIEELFSKEGMPEELLQALSRTDAQLSLPINGEGETPAAPDETENKIATAAVLPVMVETPSAIETPAETAEIEALAILTDSPAEANKIESLESVADSPAEHIADDAATTILTPEISAVDINEEVVTQLEDMDKLEVALSSSAPTPAGENEIAWISLNSANSNAAEPFTGNELAIDDLTETADELPTFASVAEVVSDHSVEPSTTNKLAIDDLTETANDLPTFASVSEVVSETLAVEAGDAADSEIEVQVVEAYDVGRAEVESPPELQSVAAEEVDGWMAEEFSPEEITEPDFIKKSEDFFLEEERLETGNVATSPEPSTNVTVVDFPEPTIVDDIAVSSVLDEVANSTTTFKNTLLSAHEELAMAEPSANTVVAFKVESETMAPATAKVNFATASHISPETTAPDAMTATTHEASLPENNDGRPTTLRERVVGWIKRTFNKLMTVIGTAPKSE